MIFRMIDKEDIKTVWPVCEPLIAKSFHHRVNIYDTDDYLNFLEDGTSQLWVAEDQEVLGAVVSSIQQGGTGRVCSIIALGGERLRDWIGPMESAITSFANDNHCAAIEVVMKKAVARFMPAFQEDDTLFVKDLRNV